MPSRLEAATIFIDFESFSEFDLVGSTSGATFTNATVLTAGSSLNEFDFPPASPVNVAADVFADQTDPLNPILVGSGPIFIVFSAAINSFSGFFTYDLTVNAQLVLEAFSDVGGIVLVDSVQSASASNLGTNEQFSLSAALIRSIRITGDPLGDSFVVDDITFETAAVSAPEPATVLLLGVGLAAFARRRLNKR